MASFIVRPSGGAGLQDALIYPDEGVPQVLEGVPAGTWQVGRVSWAPETVEVAGEPGSPPLYLGTLGEQEWTQGTPVSFSVAEHFDGTGLTYSADALPDGLSINASTGLVSGTPTATQGRTLTTFTAASGLGEGSVTIDVSVAPTEASGAYSQVIRGQTFSSQTTLDGSTYNNRLYVDCTFSGISGNGLQLRNLSGLVLKNCTFEDIAEDGMRLSLAGSTSGVVIYGNTFTNIGRNGIAVSRDEALTVDHSGLRILNNEVRNVGSSGAGSGLLHNIYVQSTDAEIRGNVCVGNVSGNGISIRSSGWVVRNFIDTVDGSGIAYFTDWPKGARNILTIADNVIVDPDAPGNANQGRSAIDLLGVSNAGNRVDVFEILDNLHNDAVTIQAGYGNATITNTGNAVMSAAALRAMFP